MKGEIDTSYTCGSKLSWLHTVHAGRTHAGDVAARGSDLVHVQADTTRTLGDERALLERVVNTLNAVAVHGQ